MTDDQLRSGSVNNEFLRALGEMVLEAARLEQLDLVTRSLEDGDRRSAWATHALELLDERDRFIGAAAAAHGGATTIRVTARDGSVVPGDAVYIAHLTARLHRHRSAGIAIGIVEPRVG